MNQIIIYLAALGFLISVFPIHVFNYVYVNTEEKFASINVTIFRFIRIYNINTIKDRPNEMQINGKNKKVSLSVLKWNFYRIFNNLCVHKIVQLSDYGLKNTNNAYVALMQNGLTNAAYKFLEINRNAVKLKNFTILNEEHSSIRYYSKTVTIINVLVIIKILLIILMEKLYALKN